MELIYPFVLILAVLVIILLFVLKFKKDSIYKSGKKVANTKYIKDDPYYKKIVKRYKICSYFIKGLCMVSILLSFLLLSRPATVDTVDNPMYKRDIFLCMDVSTSVNELNKELVEKLKETVKSLKGERFGISIFNTSSVLLVPLTDDYDYVLDVLDNLAKSLETYEVDYNYSEHDDFLYLRKYIQSGTIVGNEENGSSLIGDGLASCVYSFSAMFARIYKSCSPFSIKKSKLPMIITPCILLYQKMITMIYFTRMN